MSVADASGAAPSRRPGSSLFRIAGAEFRLQTRRFAYWLFAVVFVTVGIFYYTRFLSISPG